MSEDKFAALRAAIARLPSRRGPSRVLVADPPWKFSDSLPKFKRGAAKNYSVLTVDDICDTPIPPMMDDSVLFLWRVSSMQEEALRVMRAWGYRQKSEIVWEKLTKNEKLHFGMGRYTRMSHEVCLIGVRGKCFPKVRNVRSVFAAPKGAHSEKPQAFYDIVEELYDGPYAELYARKYRQGWDTFGDEL